MSTDPGTQTWRFCKIGLLVTGKGERDFLPDMLRSLAATGHCHFEVIGRLGQRSPITSPKRKLKMVGLGKEIPDKDATEIGLPARGYLQRGEDRFVVLVDDLEYKRSPRIQEVFGRYRKVLDFMLTPVGLAQRAAVHFLVMMLEAYYLADAAAVNGVLDTDMQDHEGDCETLRHPKGVLKRLCPGFDERVHGRMIASRLDLEKVLSDPRTCSSLRTLFAWCKKAIGESADAQYQLARGACSIITGPQIGDLPT